MAIIPDETLNQLVSDVTEIKTMLKGYNGYPGLCEDHENVKKDVESLKSDRTKFTGIIIGIGIVVSAITSGIIKFITGY